MTDEFLITDYPWEELRGSESRYCWELNGARTLVVLPICRWDFLHKLFARTEGDVAGEHEGILHVTGTGVARETVKSGPGKHTN